MAFRAGFASRRCGADVLALGRLPAGQMNGTEAAYPAHLRLLQHAGEVLWWKFEAIKLRLAEKTSLTVDFMVLPSDRVLQAHDVKGSRAIYQDDAKAKMKIAAEQFPFRFFVCFPRRVRDGGGWDVEEIGRA